MKVMLRLFGFVALALSIDSAQGQPTAGVEVAPAHEKEWEILFEDGIEPEEYARRLDFFSIEVAAISKDGRVDYISELIKSKPAKRQGERADDTRMYIGWKSGTLHAVDRRLLRKAGIASSDKELTHFFPREVQEQMQQLELEYANHHPRDIELTRFQIRPRENDDGYHIVVIEQKPPKPALD
jgi:hypothetical protein